VTVEERPDLVKPETEHVDFLEVLWRVCERKGWALLLHAVADEQRISKAGIHQPLQLSFLDVVQPHRRGYKGRGRLIAGELLARVSIHEAVTLNDCAEVLIEALTIAGYFEEHRAA
jgi:hypothetical protein